MSEWTYDEEQRAGRLQVDGAVTIVQADQLKDLLARALGQAETVLVDLSRVEQIDIAGLQLFCAAHRLASARGRAFRLAGGSGRLRAMVEAAGLARGNWCSVRERTACFWAELA